MRRVNSRTWAWTTNDCLSFFLQKGLDLRWNFMKRYELWPLFVQLFKPAKYTWNSTCRHDMSFLFSLDFNQKRPNPNHKFKPLPCNPLLVPILLPPIFNLRYYHPKKERIIFQPSFFRAQTRCESGMYYGHWFNTSLPFKVGPFRLEVGLQVQWKGVNR